VLAAAFSRHLLAGFLFGVHHIFMQATFICTTKKTGSCKEIRRIIYSFLGKLLILLVSA